MLCSCFHLSEWLNSMKTRDLASLPRKTERLLFSRLTRLDSQNTGVLRGSLGAGSRKNDCDCPHNDFQVQPNTPVIDVGHIQRDIIIE